MLMPFAKVLDKGVATPLPFNTSGPACDAVSRKCDIDAAPKDERGIFYVLPGGDTNCLDGSPYSFQVGWEGEGAMGSVGDGGMGARAGSCGVVEVGGFCGGSKLTLSAERESKSDEIKEAQVDVKS